MISYYGAYEQTHPLPRRSCGRTSLVAFLAAASIATAWLTGCASAAPATPQEPLVREAPMEQPLAPLPAG
jgi:hypothetical protein